MMLTHDGLAGRPPRCLPLGEIAGRPGLSYVWELFGAFLLGNFQGVHRPVTRQNSFLIILFPAE